MVMLAPLCIYWVVLVRACATRTSFVLCRHLNCMCPKLSYVLYLGYIVHCVERVVQTGACTGPLLLFPAPR